MPCLGTGRLDRMSKMSRQIYVPVTLTRSGWLIRYLQYQLTGAVGGAGAAGAIRTAGLTSVAAPCRQDRNAGGPNCLSRRALGDLQLS